MQHSPRHGLLVNVLLALLLTSNLLYVYTHQYRQSNRRLNYAVQLVSASGNLQLQLDQTRSCSSSSALHATSTSKEDGSSSSSGSSISSSSSSGSRTRLVEKIREYDDVDVRDEEEKRSSTRPSVLRVTKSGARGGDGENGEEDVDDEEALLPPPPPPSLSSSSSTTAESASAPPIREMGTVASLDDLSSEEIAEVLFFALGDDFSKELSSKVEAAMQQDWDVRQGVNPGRTKPLPLKANLDLWTHHARQKALQGDFTSAMMAYRNCIEYNPVDGRAWLGLAKLHQKKGQWEEADKCFKDGLYYNPKNPFLLQGWAVMLEKQGKLAEALKLLTMSVKSNPRHAASWVALAKMNQRKGKIDAARSCFASAVKGDAKSFVALQAWGVLEANEGNVEMARDLFRKATTVSSKSAHAWQAWATLERKQGNLEMVEKLLANALAAWPESTRIMLSYAEIHELRGDHHKARLVFEQGANAAAKCGDAGFFQSWALFEIRREKETRAKAKYLTHPLAVVDPGEEERQREQARNVRLIFKRAVTSNKYHSATWVAWAKHEQHQGNLEMARKLLVAGFSNTPHTRNAAWFHCSFGNLACVSGDMNTARSCYLRALDASPPQNSLSILLEFAYMEEKYGNKVDVKGGGGGEGGGGGGGGGGRNERARKLYEAAVKRFPCENRAWEALIEFETRRGGASAAWAVKERREREQGNARAADSIKKMLVEGMVEEKGQGNGSDGGSGGKRNALGGGGVDDSLDDDLGFEAVQEPFTFSFFESTDRASGGEREDDEFIAQFYSRQGSSSSSISGISSSSGSGDEVGNRRTWKGFLESTQKMEGRQRERGTSDGSL